MIKIKNIKFKYPDDSRFLFDQFNLNIKRGEIVTILGPSGCGKTTLVNLIAGYLNPLEGDIYINDKKTTKPGRDRVVINQENDLFNWMNVLENIRLVCRDEKYIEELLKLVKLEKYKRYYPHKLSGGMKKRLSLARALAVKSDFIIMDEPFSSQDIKIRNDLYVEVLNIVKEQNKTILLVTHDIDEAVFLSDRILVLSGEGVKIVKEYSRPFSGFNKEEKENSNTIKDQLKLIGYNI